MKIKKLETFCNEYVGFVRVTADSGDQGWGQVSTYNADITCEIFHRQVAPPCARHRCAGFCRHAACHQRARAQVSGFLSQARDDRPRHRIVGSARQGRRQAGGRTHRRQARQAARLCLVDEARHHAGGREGPLPAAARRTGFRRLQVARRRRMRTRQGRMAGTNRSDRAAGRRVRWATVSPSWSMPIPATRRAGRSKSAACSRRRASRISRSPVPIGNSSRPSR